MPAGSHSTFADGGGPTPVINDRGEIAFTAQVDNRSGDAPHSGNQARAPARAPPTQAARRRNSSYSCLRLRIGRLALAPALRGTRSIGAWRSRVRRAEF